MKPFFKKIRRYWEFQKKLWTGFSPQEEIALLRLHKLNPNSKRVKRIYARIKKRYFFCEKRENLGSFHIVETTDDALISKLLSSGNSKVITRFRLAAKWNNFLKKLDNEYQNYQQEKQFFEYLIASGAYYLDKDIYVSGNYYWIFDEQKALNKIRHFCPNPCLITLAKILNLTAVAETYRNLNEMTRTTWIKVFKKEFTF